MCASRSKMVAPAKGVAAEALGAKWFEKSPDFSDAQNLDQLRQALQLAIDPLRRARGFDNAVRPLCRQLPPADRARCRARAQSSGLPSYGPALLDRAIIDAVGKAAGQSFAQMITSNVPGIAATDLTPEIDADHLSRFLEGLKPRPSIDLRHTVGLVDPLTKAERPESERVNDGLPETLEEVVSHYRGRYYKLKVGGDVRADLDRLTRIASVLDAGCRRLQGHVRRQRAVRRCRRHRGTLAQGRRDAGAREDGRGDPVHRAADQAPGGPQPAGDGAGQVPPRHHRRVGRRAVDFPRGTEARLCRRLEQELQGLLQVDPQRRACCQARPGVLHVGRGPDDAARCQRPAGPGAGFAAGASPMSNATPITSSTACRRPPIPNRMLSWRRTPISTSGSRASRRGSRCATASWRWARWAARALRSVSISTSPHFRPMPAAPRERLVPAHPGGSK